ncbi:L-type lectin-domain containing receptor kinase S.6-like [Apium graveolens]|uniref:L-type lectin-domain containing receptor kinase S.6-like n=1 Tax=Apium graveolens TaxID=4045 RepID=UPI003D78C157
MHSQITKRLWVFFILLIFSTSPSFCMTTKNFTLFGDAHFKNTSISLTQELTCLPPHSFSSSSVGRAFYHYPLRFLDFSTNSIASFSCKFSFTIAPSSPYCSFGDGLVFLISSGTDSMSLFNGYMGLPESDSDDSFLAVEFDTSFDKSLGDLNGNHVSVDLNSVVSVASVDSLAKGIDLKGGRRLTAWIEYKDQEKTIRVWVGYSEFLKPLSPLLVCRIDISKSFKEFMYVGFSASNGRGSAIHSVDEWRFWTSGFVASTMLVDTFTEEVEECLICFPGDSSSTVTGNDGSDHLRRQNSVIGLALGLGGSVLIVMFVTGFLLLRKRKRVVAKQCSESNKVSRVEAHQVPKRLSLTEVRSATKGFNRKKIIGEGASAVVYEGFLPSCGTVAIKRFSGVKRTSTMYNRFTNEFGTMVGCRRHKNLVQLLGWCCERNELMLVYEYMPNGSLDRILHSRTRATKHLSWERRVNIVLGIASALVYLHEECEKQIIHRDLKTCNVMLDAEFNAKLGDFGLAEVYEHSCKARDATLPAGTMGYLAPEYVYSGIPSVKTDVYSFGVVALEVATGKKPVNDDRTVLADWVWDLWEKGLLMAGSDPALIGRFNRVEMERMFLVGLSCVHPNSEKRPTMKEAARMLKGEAPVPKLPAKKPSVRIRALSDNSEDMIQFSDKLDGTPWSTPRTHLSRN